MEDVRLVPFSTDHIEMVEEWVDHPESRVSGMKPVSRYYEFQRDAPNYWNWVAFEGNTPVAFGGFEINDRGDACLLILVAPDLRGRGYGRAVIGKLLETPEIRMASRVCCGCERTHEAAVRCVTSAGFVRYETDPEWPEFDNYVYRGGQHAVRP